MNFSASTYQNEFLPADATEVHAVVTVTASDAGDGTGPTTTSPDKAVVLIVDTSGSMGQPGTKIRAARQSVAASVEELPDGTWFAVIAGNHEAFCVYPPASATGEPPSLVRADAMTRAEAANVARQLQPEGGTAIGTWLDLARDVFVGHPEPSSWPTCSPTGATRASRTRISRLLCDGAPTCSSATPGASGPTRTWPNCASSRPRCWARSTSSPTPTRWTTTSGPSWSGPWARRSPTCACASGRPQGSSIKFLRQVAPTIDDLTAKATAVNPLTGDFPTGAWAGDESRDYHLSVNVPPGKVGDEKLAARVSLVVDGQPVSQALVKAIWTDDEALSARISPQVAHYTGQAELAVAIHEGLEARKQGDTDTATVRLGRAVQLAHESGNEGTVRLLQKVVEVDDAATGTVRLKRGVAATDEMALDTRSTRTVRVTAKPPDPSTPPPTPPAPPAPPTGA